MIERQLFPIQIGGGVDTKTDDKKVVSTKLLTLENGVFTKPGRIEKRPGYEALSLDISGGGTLVNPTGIKSYKDELICAASNSQTPTEGRLFSYSSNESAWIDKGKYTPVKTTTQGISQDNPQIAVVGALIGNYTATAWASVPSSLASNIFITIIDNTNNNSLIPETQIATAAYFDGIGPPDSCPLSIVKLSSTSFGVAYLNSSQQISIVIVSIAGSTVTIGTEIVLKNDNTLQNSNSNQFFAASYSGGAVFVYKSTTNINAFTIDSSGAVTQNATLATSFTNFTAWFFIKVDSIEQFWFYYDKQSTLNIFYAITTNALVTVLASTNTTIIHDATFTHGCKYFADENSTTQQTIYYVRQQITKKFTVTSAGVIGTPAAMLVNVYPYAPPFTVNSNTYLPVIFISPTFTQSTFFIIDVSDNRVVAKALAGKAALAFDTSMGSTLLVSPNKVQMICGYYTQVVTDFQLAGQASTIVTFDFANADLNQSLEIGNTLLWNGSILTEYDGQTAIELGFLVFPELTSATAFTSGGSMQDGTYEYFIVYTWYDNQGNFHQSAPSVGREVVVTGGGGLGRVELGIYTTGLTGKQSSNHRFPIQIWIFRTLANGTVAHLVTSQIFPLLNDPSVTSVTYTDTFPDSSIEASQTIYTTGGVLENIAPPSNSVMTIYNNRLWINDSEDQNTVWYSKTVGPAVGLSFSDLLVENIDQRQGPVTALASFDDKIVFFKKTVPFFSVGDGADDLGTNATLTLPLIVASDVGCNVPKSIIQDMPLGIMFKSDKGIYLMDRSLQCQYIGREVEAFNSQTLVSANLVDTKSQIRFLCSDGVELVYDYIYNQWSTFTNHLGVGATLWQSTYTYARVDGDIYRETPSLFVDKTIPISLKIGTSWLKLSEIQNFERLRRLFVVGDYKSPHLLNGEIYFDYETTLTSTFQFNPQDVLGLHGDDLVYQFRYHMERQKCESARIVIFDSFTGLTPGEGYSLSQFSMEAGIKQGGNKLSPYKSVG